MVKRRVLKGKIPFVVFLVLLSLFYLLPVPFLSLFAKLCIHVFLLGYFARPLLGLKGKEVLFESFLLSMAISTSVGMFLGGFVPLNDIGIGIIFCLWIIYLLSEKTVFALPSDSRFVAVIFVFSVIPLGTMLLLNPRTGLISDGWWHCSILNTLGGNLPPQNPWFAQPESILAYPYSYHVYLFLSTGGEMFCLHSFGLFALLLMFFQGLGIYRVLLLFGGKKIGESGAIITSFVFTCVSTIGGIFFLWDAGRIIPSEGLSAFLSFLKDHHGPHMWHGAMKGTYYWFSQTFGFGLDGIDPMNVGINIPFQGMAMVGGPQLLFIIGVIYFLLKEGKPLLRGITRSDLGIALCLAPLCANSPVNGLVAAVALSLFLLYKRAYAGKNPVGAIMPIGFIGIFTAVVDSSYIHASLTKGGVGGSIIGILAPNALPVLALAVLGFSPLVLLGFLVWKENLLSKTLTIASLTLVFSSLVVLMVIELGYLYFTYPLFIGIAILSGPYFKRLLENPRKNIILGIILIVLCIPNALIIGSYIYYGGSFCEKIDKAEVEAGDWISKNTPEDAVFLQNLNLEKTYDELCPEDTPVDLSQTDVRQTFNYVSLIGKRRSYLGDLRSVYVYGDNFCDALKIYYSVFDETGGHIDCSLKETEGIDYIYSSDKTWNPGTGDCADVVYGNADVVIYETK